MGWRTALVLLSLFLVGCSAALPAPAPTPAAPAARPQFYEFYSPL